MRWSTPSLALVCAAAVALGFFLGRGTGVFSKTNPASPSAPAISSAPATAAGNPAKQNSIAAPARETKEHAAALSWDSRWRDTLGEAHTPARTRKLAALIAELAKTNPEEALALARSNEDWRLRDLLRDAALRGWASVDAGDAGNWALTVRPEDRRAAVEAVMQGAAAHPDAAVKTALRLCEADPERAGDYGHYTIAGLVDSGAFQDAVRFGEQVGTEKYPFLLKSAFFQWSRNEPATAFVALNDIADPLTRAKAYGEVVAGWSWADPKGLATYALTLPAGSARAEVLSEALPRWVEKDPAAAMDWINHHENGHESDAGIAAVANLQSIITQQPATAMSMAGNLISDPALRAQTMRNVFRQWAEKDPDAARGFIAQTPEGPDRVTLLNELHDLFPDH